MRSLSLSETPKIRIVVGDAKFRCLPVQRAINHEKNSIGNEMLFTLHNNFWEG